MNPNIPTVNEILAALFGMALLACAASALMAGAAIIMAAP